MLIDRVIRIFQRYAQMQVSLDHPGRLLGDTGARIDCHALRGPRLIVDGRVQPRIIYRVGLSLGADTRWTTPDADGRFHFDLPASLDPPMLHLRGDGATDHPLPCFSAAQVRAAKRNLVWRFAAALLRNISAIARWKLGGDLGAREVIKEALGFTMHRPATEIDASVLRYSGSRPAQPYMAVTVVMPAYGTLDMLQETLERLVSNTDLHWRLLVIEDASTDSVLRSWLRDWAAGQGDEVHQLENDSDLGFVGGINRGFAMARERWSDDPVVLLNPNAMLPEGWATRLLAPLADPAIASVVPLSNDAGIFTVPVISARLDLAVGLVDALDRVAQGLATGLMRPTVPATVGSVMALSPRFLKRVPEFDTEFGCYYGCGIDWCRKTTTLGGAHVCAHELFVEFRDNASIGSASKQRLLERTVAEVVRRYPDYDMSVKEFMSSDPLATPRLALGISWAGLAQESRVPVYLGHAMGGGADLWLSNQVAKETCAGRSALVLRVGQWRRWRLELHTPYGMTVGQSDDIGPVSDLVERLPRRRIVYSCGVGDRDAAKLPELLVQLAWNGKHPIEVLFHDYFPISPSFTMCDADGMFRGVPHPGSTRAQDAVHRYRAASGAETSLAEWRAAWGRLIAAAERVTVFSEDSRAYVLEAFPQAEQSLILSPHALRVAVPRIARPKPGSKGPAIGVLGNIGEQKGAAVLQRLSRDLAALGSAAPRLIVLGNLAPEYNLISPSHVHGPYQLEDLPGLVARYGIQAWFIPSVWPETFSYTTHESLATGLPVLAFDLGAQGAAVAAAENGILLPRNTMTDPDLAQILAELL